MLSEAAMEARRFPPPWIVEDHLACFIIKDSNGQALAYVYYEEEPGRQSAVKLLSRNVSSLVNLTPSNLWSRLSTSA
jgi:hypothetical protein